MAPTEQSSPRRRNTPTAGRRPGAGVGKNFPRPLARLDRLPQSGERPLRRRRQDAKSLRHARLDHTYEQALRRLIAVDLLILDDFGLDALGPTESRDTYEILNERHRSGCIVVTSNRGPDEWLATLADPLRAQSAIDRFANDAYDLVIDGESYRKRQKPTWTRHPS
ncbi:MAG TPA: ATP-binding protein [Candidatus Binatia bacterium]|nr:ATP-binding protein [Candidatus Binatia bacterium]